MVARLVGDGCTSWARATAVAADAAWARLAHVVPVALMTLALVLAKFYWLDSELHGRIRAELQARVRVA